MADHYKTLGLTHNATKQEIKDAFRKCALKFHPDRHYQSPKSIKDGASLKFKQASEAYEVLIDNRKRADYDFRRRNSSYNYNYNKSNYNYNNKGYGYSGSSSYDYRARPRRFDFGFVFQHVTRRGFLLNVAFASVLFGGAIVIEKSVETLWSMNNSGINMSGADHPLDVSLWTKGAESKSGSIPIRRNHLKKQYCQLRRAEGRKRTADGPLYQSSCTVVSNKIEEAIQSIDEDTLRR